MKFEDGIIVNTKAIGVAVIVDSTTESNLTYYRCKNASGSTYCHSDQLIEFTGEIPESLKPFLPKQNIGDLITLTATKISSKVYRNGKWYYSIEIYDSYQMVEKYIWVDESMIS